MHELSLAMSIVDYACQEGAREGGHVAAVHVRIGDMVGIETSILQSSFAMASAGTAIDGSSLVIERVPAMIFCDACGGPQSLTSVRLLQCPACGTPSGSVTQGREIELTALELDS